MRSSLVYWIGPGLALALSVLPMAAPAPSSHGEAPNITKTPKIDATDFYLFRSYEAGRGDFVTVVANYYPLQTPEGGPNYFTMDPDALYEIHFDTNGDDRENLTFQFRFTNTNRRQALMIGPPGNQQSIEIPLRQSGPISAANTDALNVVESYSLKLVTGDRRSGQSTDLVNLATGSPVFAKPVDNSGTKSIPDYAAYAAAHIYNVALPGSTQPMRLFVGQRKDPFVVNLGETFDLVNLDPVGPPDAKANTLENKNCTSFVLEIPISFLTASGSPIIGGWTTASLRQARALNPAPDATRRASVEGGALVQQSRLSMPLFNELVVGLSDKDRYNTSEPKDDAYFRKYVTNPTVPALLQVLFGVTAPTLFPRADLVQVFLTGVPGLNADGGQGEIMRLNTGIAAVPAGQQNRLGVIAGDNAGYPNGRRPGDDVVDITIRAAMGVLLDQNVAPSGQLPYTDGALCNDSLFDATFPYLRTPVGGAPQSVPTVVGAAGGAK